jgi:hypothetical protein
MMSSQDFVLLLVALPVVGGDRGDGGEWRGWFDCRRARHLQFHKLFVILHERFPCEIVT